MANIQIKDLVESKELDREAMREIVGGRSTAAFLKPANPMASPLLTGSSQNNPFAWAAFAAGQGTD